MLSVRVCQGNRSPIRSASPEPTPSLTVSSTAGADPNAWQQGYRRRSDNAPPWHQQLQHQAQQRSSPLGGVSRGADGGGSGIARRMRSMSQVLPPVQMAPIRPAASQPPVSNHAAEDRRWDAQHDHATKVRLPSVLLQLSAGRCRLLALHL